LHSNMKKKQRKGSMAALVLVVVAAVVVGVGAARAWLCNATSYDGESHAYYVYPETPLDSIVAQIEADYRIQSKWNIRMMARYMELNTPKPGYYRLAPRFSTRYLVNHLKHGWQTPIKLSFTNQIRTRQQLAGRMGKALLLDSAQVMARLDDEVYLRQFGLEVPTAVCLFIPNTYEVYWTISTDDLFQRMYAEYQRFWNEERLQKARDKGLTPVQVATLASIVESETNKKEEHPIIASLYLNRLSKGMPLQACPTAIYASGDFTTHRVTTKLLKTDSPYNTYKYKGLPPGPIRLSTGSGMDAVLNAPKTNYLYMCANPDWSGTHVFSSTFSEHSRVGAAYRRELNKRGIRK